MLCCEGVEKEEVSEVYMGNVCQASLGQNPARQAALFAGLSSHLCCLLAFVVDYLSLAHTHSHTPHFTAFFRDY